MEKATKSMLREMAERYETADFINGDPSWFMHQVTGNGNQETIAFLASVLSYGRRDIFLPKIQQFLDWSGNEPLRWVLDGAYRDNVPDDTRSFYRLYNNHMMRALLDALHDILSDNGSIGGFIRQRTPEHRAVEALEVLSQFFYSRGIKGMVPSPLFRCQAPVYVSQMDGTRWLAGRLRTLGRLHRQADALHPYGHACAPGGTRHRAHRRQDGKLEHGGKAHGSFAGGISRRPRPWRLCALRLWCQQG